jgi:hypothetical protein
MLCSVSRADLVFTQLLKHYSMVDISCNQLYDYTQSVPGMQIVNRVISSPICSQVPLIHSSSDRLCAIYLPLRPFRPVMGEEFRGYRSR